MFQENGDMTNVTWAKAQCVPNVTWAKAQCVPIKVAWQHIYVPKQVEGLGLSQDAQHVHSRAVKI